MQIHPAPTTVFTFLFHSAGTSNTQDLEHFFLPPSGDLSPFQLDTGKNSCSWLREALSPSIASGGDIPKDMELQLWHLGALQGAPTRSQNLLDLKDDRDHESFQFWTSRAPSKHLLRQLRLAKITAALN